ncbi:LysM domain-containing protein [Halanaerobium saccharolyticum]|uniref:LysM domain-containing protein n=1 Tax=Halanaerobium saccharolyticum TaxID=43595 RepID=A0A4R7Z4I0_9FIRM|nr:5'-nucleotidase C-terminal domain-containing protein [Halanaerobium saccharolyticum]RAK12663.1 LysM domain-containing protein [Halanaerobium saccharolyticum]TDW05425.1 LysM domain-containing protein [Halanaerobium saccharolyticum]TDX62940.1 LysM domain-containing protein [Halanaerobium saccharolyticum]
MGKLSVFLAVLLLLSSPLLLAADDKKIEVNGDSINLEDDQQIMELKNEIEKKSELEKDMFIGSTVVFLNGEADQIRSCESNLGALITDAILNKVEADLVLINSRTINSSIDKGLISVRDVREAIPAKDEVVVKKIKGKQLLKSLSHSVSKYPETAGFFPQVSGIKIIFAGGLELENEVIRATINSKPLKAEAEYLIATNDSLAAGGDGFEELEKAEEIKNTGRLDQILIEYLQQQEIVENIEMNRIIPVRKEGNNYLYQVQKGDYLYLIAEKFSVSIAEIMEANGLQNRNLIYQGQQLIIPGLR